MRHEARGMRHEAWDIRHDSSSKLTNEWDFLGGYILFSPSYFDVVVVEVYCFGISCYCIHTVTAVDKSSASSYIVSWNTLSCIWYHWCFFFFFLFLFRLYPCRCGIVDDVYNLFHASVVHLLLILLWLWLLLLLLLLRSRCSSSRSLHRCCCCSSATNTVPVVVVDVIALLCLPIALSYDITPCCCICCW